MGIRVSSPTMIGNPFSPNNTSSQDGFNKFSNAMQAGLDMGSISSQPKKPSWQDTAGYFGNRLMDLGGVGGRKGAAQRKAGEIMQGYGNFGGRSEQVGDGMYMYTPDRMGPLIIGGGAASEERSTGQRIAGAAGGALSGAAAGSTIMPGVGTAIGGALGGISGFFG